MSITVDQLAEQHLYTVSRTFWLHHNCQANYLIMQPISLFQACKWTPRTLYLLQYNRKKLRSNKRSDKNIRTAEHPRYCTTFQTPHLRSIQQCQTEHRQQIPFLRFHRPSSTSSLPKGNTFEPGTNDTAAWRRWTTTKDDYPTLKSAGTRSFRIDSSCERARSILPSFCEVESMAQT